MRTLISLEGNRQRLDGGAMFGNAPRALWTRWLPPDGEGRVPLACRSLLVREEGRNILLEAGIGAFFEPAMRERYGVEGEGHQLLASLAAVGLTHQDIDAVVLSHLHFDHAGGLLEPWQEGRTAGLLFPRATYLVGAAQWERANHPHLRDRASYIPHLNQLLRASGRLELVEGERSPTLGDGWRLHRSDGHTVGMMHAELETGAGPLFFAGDLAPGTAWVHLPITMGYDRAGELLVDEKRRYFSSLAARGGRLFFTHDPQAAVARVVVDGRGRFSAAAPASSLDEVIP
ncbi:MAG: MBL fold metallo-hydrolase [Deltaproteobacteria bacterium]|nr:MBL fold metallo-hydrolase [Deltaproteobacteria bacterium]